MFADALSQELLEISIRATETGGIYVTSDMPAVINNGKMAKEAGAVMLMPEDSALYSFYVSEVSDVFRYCISNAMLTEENLRNTWGSATFIVLLSNNPSLPTAVASLFNVMPGGKRTLISTFSGSGVCSSWC